MKPISLSYNAQPLARWVKSPTFMPEDPKLWHRLSPLARAVRVAALLVHRFAAEASPRGLWCRARDGGIGAVSLDLRATLLLVRDTGLTVKGAATVPRSLIST